MFVFVFETESKLDCICFSSGKDVGEMSELEKKRKFNRDCQRRYRERQKMRSVGLLEPKPGDTRTVLALILMSVHN